MLRKKRKPQNKSWFLLILTFVGAKALIKKFGLDK
jgi:hypothetical protein